MQSVTGHSLPGCHMGTPVLSALHLRPEDGRTCQRKLLGMVTRNTFMRIAIANMQSGLMEKARLQDMIRISIWRSIRQQAVTSMPCAGWYTKRIKRLLMRGRENCMQNRLTERLKEEKQKKFHWPEAAKKWRFRLEKWKAMIHLCIYQIKHR